ncbi:MAG: response regulator [Prevotellaceae bacterium]|jgi:ligand-binding sensor domain-containing protein/signal transduction histidine kinase/CheY-like chemotaxis protein/AraC-like DNA-binding protein|nr:response regulator [Prevotellaceae bacterium]
MVSRNFAPDKIYIFKFLKIVTTIVALLSFIAVTRADDTLTKLKFKHLNTLPGFSCNDVQKVYQDKEGYVWVATRNGLLQYDGYSVKTYKSNFNSPNLLSDNNVLCVVEDNNHRLWIGTYHGLNMLDKITGKIQQIRRPEFEDNVISEIVVTKKGELYLGTDQGLFRYIYENDSCIIYNRNNTGNVLPQTTVKSLFEDSRGDFWIGTWNEGLYRYEQETGKYYSYPRMNQQNSAHVIFEDSQKRIWVGTWEQGLNLLENIYSPDHTTWKTFNHHPGISGSILDNRIYSISEDINTKTLWVGTRSGLSILPMNDFRSFDNYYPMQTEYSISGDEVSSIIRDRQGMMWIGMVGGGVNNVNTKKPFFSYDNMMLNKTSFRGSSVRSIMVDSSGFLWLGIGSYGLIVKNRKTGEITQCPHIQSSVFSLIQSSFTGKIWVGTYGGGIYVYDGVAQASSPEHYLPANADWLPGFHVYAIKEDSEGNMWIGTRNGLSIFTADGISVRFDSVTVNGKSMDATTVSTIEEGNEGEMWAAVNNGIIRISGKGANSGNYTFESFSINNGKLNSLHVRALYKDGRGNIWAGTDGGGLSVFDTSVQSFIPKSKEWNLSGDAVFSILGDKQNNLWLGTNAGLINLKLADGQLQSSHLYTTSDGLQDNIFTRNAAFVTNEDEMFFGGHNGYNYFFPGQLTGKNSILPVVITDIKILNHSLFSLDEATRNSISKVAPGFTQNINLDYKHNNISIEFSTLGYIDSEQTKYACKLDGFDRDWIYTDAFHRAAYYNNLEAGTYSLYVKAINPDGTWTEKTLPLTVNVLPPPWKTWWAYLIYFISISAFAFLMYYAVRNRLHFQNTLRIKELEKTKSEEINHAKLQFFSNITHELFTPLTIISATVEELKNIAPQNQDDYKVISISINRLIRLLQQILEFRKTETGNLKLKVSKGDLAAFIKNAVDSFRPLMKKKMIQYHINCNPEIFPAYFDTDKMDKILYNLLSNAAKYNNQGGTVWINLNMDEEKRHAILNVRDNGKGITKEALKTLFKRFYEGDYRRFNTIGTGIGLSLTKDLVELHGGTISVESEVDNGADFRIVIPVGRESYSEDNIDDEILMPPFAPLIVQIEESAIKEPSGRKTGSVYSVLLLEDDEELLDLMTNLLNVDYDVFTGTNGNEGLEIIKQENIDIIISDVMMPEMDGIIFCRNVKKDIETCHIPVILLTAKNSEDDRVEAYDSGADAYINKPFNLTVLRSRIVNLLKSKERVMRDFKKQLVFEAQELNYTSLDENFLQRAIDCVQKHLNDCLFDQEQFICEMATSKATLHRKLKNLTGLNSSGFIKNIRLKAACVLMKEKKNIRISELAYAVGFNDPKYFSICFKKEFGIYPSEYVPTSEEESSRTK